MASRNTILVLLLLSGTPAVFAKESTGCTALDVRRALEQRLSADERAHLTVPFEADTEIRALALRVTAPAHSDQGKLDLLVRFFRREGFLDGYQKDWTRTARDVLESKRGNCLSYASLFVAMARSAGLRACFLDGSRIEPEFGPTGSVLVEVGHVLPGVQIGPDLVPVNLAGEDGFSQRFEILSDLEAIADYYNNRGFEIAWTRAAEGGLARKDARSAFELATRIEPRFARAWNNLGVSYTRSGDLLAAENSFRRAVQAEPGLAAAHANLGQIHVRRDEQSQAIERFSRAIELDGANAHYRYFLGKALARAGRMSEAIAELERALSLNPRLFPAWVQLMKSRQASGDIPRARAAALEALKLQPGQRDAKQFLDRHPEGTP